MVGVTDIVFNNVRYCYGEVCAVNSVNFSLMSKKLTVLIGPNGGGKSTLIKLLSGLLRPEEGAIISRNGLEVGYVPQNSPFDSSFPITVGDMVLQGTLTKAIKPFNRYLHRDKLIASEAIRRVGLNGFEHRGIGQLSGGQLKRAVIARALASDADMIVLDEPDASLDVDAAKELYGVLASLKSEKSIVIASHHIDAVLDIADKAVYVNKTVIEYASPQELKGVMDTGMVISAMVSMMPTTLTSTIMPIGIRIYTTHRGRQFHSAHLSGEMSRLWQRMGRKLREYGICKNGIYTCPACGSAKVTCRQKRKGKLYRAHCCWRHGWNQE